MQRKFLVFILFLFISHDAIAHIAVRCDDAQQAEFQEAWELTPFSEKNELLDRCIDMIERWLSIDVRLEEDTESVTGYLTYFTKEVLNTILANAENRAPFLRIFFPILKTYHRDVRERCIARIERAKESLEEELQDPQRACRSGHQNLCKRRAIARDKLEQVNEAFLLLRDWNENSPYVQCSRYNHVHPD